MIANRGSERVEEPLSVEFAGILDYTSSIHRNKPTTKQWKSLRIQ